MPEQTKTVGGGCGCLSLIIFIFVVWAIFFGVSIGAHKWNIDFFPPRIWDMNETIGVEP